MRTLLSCLCHVCWFTKACCHLVSMHRGSYWRFQWAWLSYTPQVKRLQRSLEDTNTPVIFPSITMAIPHFRTSISHLLFKGRSYWHTVVGLCWALLLQRLLVVSFSRWQDDVCWVMEIKCVTFGLGSVVGVSVCTHRNSQRSISGNNLTAANASLFPSGLRPHTLDYSQCHVTKAVGSIGIWTARFIERKHERSQILAAVFIKVIPSRF